LPREYTGRTDRQLVIEWLKRDLAYYKENIGKITEFDTLITEDLIDTVMERIWVLEEK
tara:strand:- start:912 stop:1085 length:174 start_codon:yes stop_codon:yes gene_type:complete